MNEVYHNEVCVTYITNNSKDSQGYSQYFFKPWYTGAMYLSRSVGDVFSWSESRLFIFYRIKHLY